MRRSIAAGVRWTTPVARPSPTVAAALCRGGGAPSGGCARRLHVGCLPPARCGSLQLVLPRAEGVGFGTLRRHRVDTVLCALNARRSYSASSAAAAEATRKRSGGKGREVEKVITDITQHLADLDAEKRQQGGVNPKHVAAVLKMVWEGREHISEKGREGERLLRHLKSLRGDASGCSVEGFTDLISALAKFGLTEDCFAVFDRMKSVGLRPNEWTYSALIGACGPRRDRKRAQQVFEEMRQREDLKPDAVTYTLLLKANEGRTVGEVKQAMQVLSEIKKAGIVPNVRLFDALINVVSGDNFLEGKVGLNQEKREMAEGKAHGNNNNKHRGRVNMHEQAQAQKEMREMGKARRLELVLEVLERMKEFDRLTSEISPEPLKANIHLFNSLFRAYELNGENQSDFEEAFVVFEELMRPRPNVETYTTLLKIAAKMRYRDHGERLIKRMRNKAKDVINSKASEGERAELEQLKVRVRKLPLSPEAVLQSQLAADKGDEDEADHSNNIIDSTVA